MSERVNPGAPEERRGDVSASTTALAPPIDLDRFVRTDYPRVVAAVGLMTGDRHGAEDAVQDALARLLSDPPPVPLRSVAAWVTVAARNGATSRHRRRSAERRALVRLASRAEQQPGAADQTRSGSAGDHGEVMAAIADLADQQREICVLHYYLDLSVADIASTLGVSEGTVKTQLHRARRNLAEALGTSQDELHDAADDAPHDELHDAPHDAVRDDERYRSDG